MKNRKIIVFDNIKSLDDFSLDYLNREVNNLPANNFFTIALSGGTTPEKIYNFFSRNYSDKIDWERIKIFWGDERCVPPDDKESNFRMTFENLIKHIHIPEKNIYRIYGENEPHKESHRYSELLKRELRIVNNIPSFDLIILGLGEDGHTVSIFPGQIQLFNSNELCVTTVHPVSNQKRITITGKIINNAKKVAFLVMGEKKSKIVFEILNEKENAMHYPAFYVNPQSNNLTWIIDKEAAKLLDCSDCIYI